MEIITSIEGPEENTVVFEGKDGERFAVSLPKIFSVGEIIEKTIGEEKKPAKQPKKSEEKGAATPPDTPQPEVNTNTQEQAEGPTEGTSK